MLSADTCNSRAFDTDIDFIFVSISVLLGGRRGVRVLLEVDNLCVDGSSRSSVLPWAESKQQWRWLPDVTPAKKDGETHLLALNPEAGEKGRGALLERGSPHLGSPRSLSLGGYAFLAFTPDTFGEFCPFTTFCGLLSLRASLLERALFTRHIFIFFHAGRLLPTFRFFNIALLCDCLVNKLFFLSLCGKNAFNLVLE